ncbi:hypothetical protein [Alkalibaculum sporogenes]|uniref:hypothetical protein n=1 Tax=Alkalibaculum sporogenes TaxID=2655001 RepID=UPI00187BA8DC|nr:hypothetical protein [Alkalibaculum sporogenes]
MKYLIIIATTIVSAALMVMGMLYVIDQKQQEKIGGKLIKVDYKFSKEFNV